MHNLKSYFYMWFLFREKTTFCYHLIPPTQRNPFASPLFVLFDIFLRASE